MGFCFNFYGVLHMTRFLAVLIGCQNTLSQSKHILPKLRPIIAQVTIEFSSRQFSDTKIKHKQNGPFYLFFQNESPNQESPTQIRRFFPDQEEIRRSGDTPPNQESPTKIRSVGRSVLARDINKLKLETGRRVLHYKMIIHLFHIILWLVITQGPQLCIYIW